jgi:hypothetical protein
MATTTTTTVPERPSHPSNTGQAQQPDLAKAIAAPIKPTQPVPIEPFTIEDNDTQKRVIADSEVDYPSGTRLYAILIALSLAIILCGLDQAIVATAVPAITDHFHTFADVGWYASAYRLMSCAFQVSERSV